MGKVLCVYNQKGGVGKTTTVVNLAAALGSLKKKLLVVDIDPQANTTSGLGVDKNGDHDDIYDALSGLATVEEILVPTSAERVWLLPASVALTGFEIEAIGRERREFVLKDLIEDFAEAYDYVLIDCPPSLGLLSLNALCAADAVIIPIQTEYYALEGVSQLISTVDMVRNSLNPKLEIEGILLSMYDGRNNLALDVVNEVKKYFGSKVFQTVIPRNIRLAEAPSYGESVITYDPSSKGAIAYMKLGRELIRNQRKEN